VGFARIRGEALAISGGTQLLTDIAPRRDRVARLEALRQVSVFTTLKANPALSSDATPRCFNQLLNGAPAEFC
jgi:hypothetical protein